MGKSCGRLLGIKKALGKKYALSEGDGILAIRKMAMGADDKILGQTVAKCQYKPESTVFPQ